LNTRVTSQTALTFFLATCLFAGGAQAAGPDVKVHRNARIPSGAYLPLVPNSAMFGCDTCHLDINNPRFRDNPPTNPQFRVDFYNFGHTWNPMLALMDSDGDGYSNGQELQDPQGKWAVGLANPGKPELVSNPSDSGSTPRGTPAAIQTVRTLPAFYTPGVTFNVAIQVVVNDATGIAAYIVSDFAPSGWVPSNLNGNGATAGIGPEPNKVSFISLGVAARTVTYDVTPPGGASGDGVFTGTVQYNRLGVPNTIPTTGDSIVGLPVTDTPVPSNTPPPTNTPDPTSTAVPSDTPVPTNTSEPATNTPVVGQFVLIEPIKDNSIYENDSSFSNGAGTFLFSGRTTNFGSRRLLLEFDVAGNVPAGSTIVSATLMLHVEKGHLL
jgi:hypothetical protein